MKNDSTHSITVHNKRYYYTIKPVSKDLVFFECAAARIAQNFEKDDVADLLVDLPELILEEIEHGNKMNVVIRFRVSNEEKALIEKKAVKKGFRSVSSYLRDLAMKS